MSSTFPSPFPLPPEEGILKPSPLAGEGRVRGLRGPAPSVLEHQSYDSLEASLTSPRSTPKFTGSMSLPLSCFGVSMNFGTVSNR